MTFRCQHCGSLSEKGESGVRVVTQVRMFNHPFREKANRTLYGEYTDDPGGTGTQIVKELLIRQRCVLAVPAVVRGDAS